MEGTILSILDDIHYGKMTFEKVRMCLSMRGIKAGRNSLWKELHELEEQKFIVIEKRGHGYHIKLVKDQEGKWRDK